MSCWRVLELSDPLDVDRVPQLLVKPSFGSSAYSIFLTDLSNIWSEELDLAGIVGRASEEESPIEVSEQDPSQLGILLETIQKSLASNDDTSCEMTRTGTDGIILYTTISLPEPLDSLKWKFSFCKRTAVTLKNELILPLLVSSHVQHERINGLITTIAEKDRAITRLVDQYETSNLDLAAAFPSIGGLKSGRKSVKREQAAKHIPGLQPFHETSWKKATANLHDADVSTLGLFQEALTECAPRIPTQLMAEDNHTAWWFSVGTVPRNTRPGAKSKWEPQEQTQPLRGAAAESDTEEDETEDEFEIHEHFKVRLWDRTKSSTNHKTQLRQPTKEAALPFEPSTVPAYNDPGEGANPKLTDTDDEDLDMPARSHKTSRDGHRQATFKESSLPESWSRQARSSPSEPVEPLPSVEKPKGKGFRMGGKAKRTETPVLPTEGAGKILNNNEEVPTRFRDDAGDAKSEPKPAKKAFKIGGKGKAPTENPSTDSPQINEDTPAVIGISSTKLEPDAAGQKVTNDTPMGEDDVETAEEKAERKRRELKRKNEEATKKQAQNKKKKRF